ncbi:hypothetical protein [Mesorhizobium kowhaii]|uniref:hypothetical protein n=1 Tax=Mesorhizobium kowhaii TaxID=1300272 RepID=UPI0011B63CD3|nr:hypothetical protein [Mesorhizobium kowhaii]
MRSIATLVVMSILTTHAAAIERHNISQMSCGAIDSALKLEQHSILRHPSSGVEKLALYDLYVRDRQSCSADQTAVLTQVPAEDGSCNVYRCATVTKTFKRL